MPRLALLVVVILLLPACRTFTSPARSTKLSNDVVWLDYDASRRGTLVYKIGDKVHVLSEPSPDVAVGVVSEFLAKVDHKDITAEASAKITESVSELGKRTQTIMFLREALFRLNELRHGDSGFDKNDLASMYSDVLKTALELARADRANAEIELYRVDPNRAVAIMQSEATRALQAELDELLARDVTVDRGGKKLTPRQVAQEIVDAAFAGKSLLGIKVRGGEDLQKLVDGLKAELPKTQ